MYKKQNSVKRGKIVIVGGLPPPIGGVTSHISRLAKLLAANGFCCTIIDLYPSENKVIIEGVDHLVCPVKGFYREILWFLCALGKVEGDIVHFHFSRIVGRFLCSLLLIKHNRRLILTLHHGDQLTVMNNAFWPLRLLTKVALRRMDRIVALSNEQQIFYRKLGVAPDRIIRWHTSIPIGLKPDPSLLPAEVLELFPTDTTEEDVMLMTSGYPTQSYGYEACVELLDHLSDEISCRLVVILYGIGSDPLYEKELRRKLLKHPKVILLGPLPAEGFLALLSKVSLYLRPSTVDSYGLAIQDALDMGTPCLASDVCSRDPRCKIFPAGDKEAFIRKATSLIKRCRVFSKEDAREQNSQVYLEMILKCYQ